MLEHVGMQIYKAFVNGPNTEHRQIGLNGARANAPDC